MTATASTARVAVMIPTIGRESLLETLRSVSESARAAPHLTVVIIVADDDPAGAGAARAAEFHATAAEIHAVAVGARNISHARNACLTKALELHADYAVFIDDDQWVEAEWLSELVRVSRDFDAAAVFGPNIAHYHEDAPRWFVRADPFTKSWSEDGLELSRGSTGNSLTRVADIRALDLRFDPDLGRSGGEDTDFFERLRASGGSLVTASRAISHEFWPLDRATLGFVYHRSLRAGQTHARLAVAGRGAARQLVFHGFSAFKSVGFGLIAAIQALTRRPNALNTAMRAWMNAGKVRELFKMPLSTFD